MDATEGRPAPAVLVLAVGTVALLLAAGLPPGYPSNDAGAYHRMVELWVEHGHPVFIGWNEMTLLGHLQSGVMLAWCGLDSIEARQVLVGLQTLAAAVLLLILGRTEIGGVDRGVAAAVTWLSSPLVLLSATSFMTEVPTALWMLGTLAAFTAWHRHDRRSLLLVVITAGVAAFSVRQTAIVLVPALGFAGWRLEPRRRWATWSVAGAILVLDCVLWWWRSTLPLASIRSTADMLIRGGWLTRTGVFLQHATECLLTAALLLLPLAVAALPVPVRRLVRVSLPVGGVATLVLLMSGSTFPFWGNILTREGLLPDVIPHSGPLPTVLAPAVCVAATAVAVAGLSVLAGAIAWRRLMTEPLGGACIVSAGALAAAASTAASPFDRYLVPLTALTAVAAVRGLRDTSRPALRIATTLAVVLAAASAVGVRGLHDRQRAVWSVATGLTAQGVPPRTIDGGFEWNMAHQPVPFDPSRLRPIGSGDPWYLRYPFTKLQPTRRLWVGTPPRGWEVSERHVIPGGLELDVLRPVRIVGEDPPHGPARGLRTPPRD